MSEIVCCECGSVLTAIKLATYEYSFMGLPLILHNSVIKYVCNQCDNCKPSIHVPDEPGLMAAVALTRVKMPEKLKGHEIAFLRKAIDLPAKVFANRIEVAPETLSRWENNKAPMSSLAERVLRLMVAIELGPKAIGIDIDLNIISNMPFKSVYDVDAIVFEFERVKVKEDCSTREAYSQAMAA